MLKNYLRIAYAVLMRRKFFTFISLFGITFTLAILMATIAIIDNTFGEIPPEVNQDRTLVVFSLYYSRKTEDGNQTMRTIGISKDFLKEMTQDLPRVERVSFSTNQEAVTSYHDSEQLESQIKYVDTDFWSILQFDFIEGRPFTKDEFANADMVAVINETTRSKFFEDSPATGRSIELGGIVYHVVGVVRDVPFIRQIPFADIWLPLSLSEGVHVREQVWGSSRALIMAEDSKYFPQIKEEFLSRVETYRNSLKNVDALVCVPETLFEGFARQALAGGDSKEDASLLALLLIILLGILFMILPTVNLQRISKTFDS